MDELLQQLLDHVRSALRFRWYGLLVAWLVCVAGWTWVTIQPDVYEATASVYVDTSSVLQPVLGNRIIAPNVETQIAYVREALLGYEQMAAVARGTGLDSHVTTSAQQEDVIRALQAQVRLQTARGGPRNSPDGVYTITYRNARSDTAVAVVTAILDTFMETTHNANQQQGDTAERFLDDRVKEYELRLARAEEALAQFKKNNAGRLPGNEGGYYARMQRERDALAEAERNLKILQSRRAELEAQLRGERSNNPDGGSLEDPPPNSLDARIQEYEARLDQLLLEFTEKHPDVIAVRNTLDRLKAQRDAQLAALGIDDESQDLAALSDNPIYQAQRVAINETDVEIATVQADIALRRERIDELQGLIDEVPEVEAQLARLDRDYEVVYDQYRALVRSRETQELTRKAADTDQIDFRVIDPPLASVRPVAPDRLMLFSAVFAAAIAAGAALCYLLAQMRPVFATGKALRNGTGLPVLGTVMFAWPKTIRAKRRRASLLYISAAASLVLTFGAILAVEVVGPGMHQLIG